MSLCVCQAYRKTHRPRRPDPFDDQVEVANVLPRRVGIAASGTDVNDGSAWAVPHIVLERSALSYGSDTAERFRLDLAGGPYDTGQP
jgi:hypothetical protein